MVDDNKNSKITAEALVNAFKDEEPNKAKKRKVSVADLELAFTVLLVDIASCDQNFEPNEYLIIGAGLRRLFGTSKDKVQSLVNQANTIMKNLRGTSRYAAFLRDNLDIQEKKAVMEVVDELIMSDGAEEGFERYLRTKLADLLGVNNELTTDAIK